MPNPFWPIRVRCHPMLLIVLWVLAALSYWAVIHVGARDDPPEWDEPEDGLPPFDPRTWQDVTSADRVMARWLN